MLMVFGHWFQSLCLLILILILIYWWSTWLPLMVNLTLMDFMSRSQSFIIWEWGLGSRLGNSLLVVDNVQFVKLPIFSQGVLHQERLLELVLAWKERVKEQDGTLPQGGPSWSGEMGRWLAGVRMNGVTLTQPPGMSTQASPSVTFLTCKLPWLTEGNYVFKMCMEVGG